MGLTSFKTLENPIFPCHPAGDRGVCVHRLHIQDNWVCTHFDAWGNRIHAYDWTPCGHWTHAYDIYDCSHICY